MEWGGGIEEDKMKQETLRCPDVDFPAEETKRWRYFRGVWDILGMSATGQKALGINRDWGVFKIWTSML